MSAITVRQARPADAGIVELMLREAAAWVDALGATMWEDGELDRARIEADVAAGQFFLADVAGEPAGALRFQLEDPLFWPDCPAGEAAFIHRVVVRRAFKGSGVSSALFDWAVRRARAEGRATLRLDCDAARHKLRRVYEAFGFRLHSYRHVGPYYVARYEYLTQADRNPSPR